MQGTNAHVTLETAGADFDASVYARRPFIWRRSAFWFAPATHALQQRGVAVAAGAQIHPEPSARDNSIVLIRFDLVRSGRCRRCSSAALPIATGARFHSETFKIETSEESGAARMCGKRHCS